MFSSKKRNAQAAAAAQARQEAALRGAGLGVSSSLANRREKEHERSTSSSTTASRGTGLASPPLASPIFGIPPPPSSSATARQWDGSAHERTESASTVTRPSVEKGLSSPQLGLTFDFELPPSPALSSKDTFGTDAFFRPSTSDGPGIDFGEESGRKSSVTAPTLPSTSALPSRQEEAESDEDQEVPLAFLKQSRQEDKPVQRETERPKPPTAPPPPIPITPKTKEIESPVSPPSQPPPQPPQISERGEPNRSFLSQPPPRSPSITPTRELETESPVSKPPSKPRIPPPQAPKAKPKPKEISIPPPPPIPPPEIPASKDRDRDQSDNISTTSTRSKRSRIKSFFFDKPNPDFLSQGRPSSSGGPSKKMATSQQEIRPSTSHGSMPKMEPSLFPTKDIPSVPRQDSLPIMNRAWLDARDKPYQNTTSKAGQKKGPYLQQAQSTPDLLSASTASPASSKSPNSLHISTNRSPLSSTASADPSPLSPSLTFVRPAGSFPKTTAESEVSSPAPTLGTPYQETSPSFPLPQHVQTRPKTAGAATANMGGVNIPTHYSSSNIPTRPDTSSGGKEEKTDKKERRKTRLLNPMNLLSRRKSSQDEEVAQNEKAVQAAQAQALQKQKTVAMKGVDKIPENYDPRIKGRVVHDFSAPRGSRRTDSFGEEPAWNAVARGLQSAHSAPFMPAATSDGRQSQASGSGSGSGRHLSVSTMATSSTSALDQRSRYQSGMGAFHEHLSETPDRGSRISSLQAEKRENKDFLQRASHFSEQSQESAVLPPFARRSQAVDQYSFSDESKRGSEVSKVPTVASVWKENRDSGVSSMSGVSPVTARNSSAVGASEKHMSFSPVSPTSPSGGKNGHDLRPPSAVSPAASEGRPPSSYFSMGVGPKSNAVSPMEEKTAPARSPNEAPKEEPTSKKDKKKGFSIKIPRPGRSNTEGSPRVPSAASGKSSSPIKSPTSRSVKSTKSAKSGKSGRSLAGTPSVHSLPSNVPTPEPQEAQPGVVANAPKSPRLVDKLASGFGKKSSKKDKLEHHVSNASRFSFQFGGSAAEEQALEEKARKVRANGGTSAKPQGDDDDDDFFDEDAMDDMDEMEMQAQGPTLGKPVMGDDGIMVNQIGGPHLSLLQQVHMLQAQQAQQQSQQQAPQQFQQDAVFTQAQAQAPPAFRDSFAGPPSRSSVADFMYRTSTPTTKPKPQLQLDVQEHDSGESDDDESGYWDNDDLMGGYAHTRDGSVVDPSIKSPMSANFNTSTSPSLGASTGSSPGQSKQRQRGASAASAHGLTLNTNVGSGAAVAPAIDQQLAAQPTDAVRAAAAAFVQDTLSQQARSGFYMQPSAAGYSPKQGEQQASRPALPQRDSGNSERNRIASGLTFGAATKDSVARHRAALSSSTLSSNTSVGEDGRPFSQSTIGGSSSSEPRTTSTGLGLSVFNDFKFTDSAASSRPLSLENQNQNQNRRSRDSETIPLDVNFGQSSPGMLGHGRNSSGWTSEGNSNVVKAKSPGKQSSLNRLDDDDMYFDDGGFEEDVDEVPYIKGGVDESAFDFDDIDRINGVGQAVQPPNANAVSGHRPVSGLTVTSLESDGPYPSFAMPNANKARQRDSRYLLEDLPLQDGPVDPRLIPRRNPSEDAKRLGLSDKAPPLPAQVGSMEAVQKVSASLQAYHAALAGAANKAAADGRFLRQPSMSTTRSGSVYSKGDSEGDDVVSRDRSHYSKIDDGGPSLRTNGVTDLNRNESVQTTQSKMSMGSGYSPTKLNFDFGFDAGFTDDASVDDFDDLGNDDDIVAAANAEALASDDEGFYGQEFGFYAKARPNSGDAQFVNGGYFGEDGDDGLTRNKSIKEPNLTPITERSEFSTRNSFIGLGGFGPPSAGPISAGSFNSMSPAMARLPYSPLVDGEVTSFDQLRKLRAHAFGGSNASLHSDNRSSNASLPQITSDSPTWSTRSSAAAQGYFGPLGGAPMTFGYSTDSSGSSNPSSAHPQQGQQLAMNNHMYQDSPHSAGSSGHLPFSMSNENEITPKRPPRDTTDAPLTVKKVPAPSNPGMSKGAGHSRTSSKDSVTYVQDPAGTWVQERRRMSEQGQLELVAREALQSGWI